MIGSEIMRRNCLIAFGKFYSIRARRSVPSLSQFWTARAAAVHAARHLPDQRAKVIWSLLELQADNPMFQTFCESLCKKPA